MRFAVAVVACMGLAGCAREPSARPVGAKVELAAPLGLPAVAAPKDNPPTRETIALGKRLYLDPMLSSDGRVSCASCHNPRLGYTDQQVTSAGVNNQRGKRNAPTVLNAAYHPAQFWDGRAASLEEQALGPIANPIEMNLPHAVCVQKLNADAEYRAAFEKAFGPGEVTMAKVAKAIASFERTLVSGNSAFDRFQYGGDREALSAAAWRGLGVFTDAARGNCVVCHTIEPEHALFTDGKFHNLGVGLDANGELRDLGRYEQTKQDADRGAFRTPTLRNVALTAPYMHDGSLKTLRAVIDFYIGGGSSNPHLDQQMKPLKLTRRDREDLLAFLESLTGDLPKLD